MSKHTCSHVKTHMFTYQSTHVHICQNTPVNMSKHTCSHVKTHLFTCQNTATYTMQPSSIKVNCFTFTIRNCDFSLSKTQNIPRLMRGPWLWNSLPVEMKKTSCLMTFKRLLKTHLFRAVYESVSLFNLFFLPLFILYMFYINFYFTKCHTHYFIINIPFILIMIFS